MHTLTNKILLSLRHHLGLILLLLLPLAVFAQVPVEDDAAAVTLVVTNISPVVLTCPTNTTVAACQSQAAVNTAFATWLATASASGGCNGVLTNNNTGAPLACGGSTTVTFTYTSTCAPFITACNATFAVSAPTSATPVFTNCTNNTVNLGCNPNTLPSCTGISGGGFGGTVTASNSCGSVPVNCSAGSITINGCTRTQVFTFEATACGQTVTCTRTFTWTQVTPPSFGGTCGNGVTNLGCNPATLPTCDPNVTASNQCGPITVTCNVGAITVNGCDRQQTLTYVANASGCGTFSTCQRVFNWQVTTAPVFGNCDNTIDLGCNPASLPSCANINQTGFGGAITATNECGNVLMSCSPGVITSNGCNRTQIFTITATACGLSSTCTRTFTWQIATAPVFANCTSGTTDLGCNPSTLPSCDAGVTASSECGAVTVVCTPGSITSSGCNRTQIFSYVATACGLSSTCTRTFTWKVDPTATLTCPNNQTVAACQTQAAVNGQFATWLATASFSGGCSGTLTNNNTGAPSFCGGSVTVTFTLNSACLAPQTCQATFTVTAAPAPQLTCPNPLTRPVCQTRAQDSIAMQNWVNTSSFSGGCSGSINFNGFDGKPPSSCGGTKTLTMTYTSSCAAPLTCTSTFTIPAPTAPVLTCPTSTTVPFGQTQAQVNAAFVTWLSTGSGTGGCNGVLSNNNVGAPPATGGSTTVTFSYSQNPPSTDWSGACPFSTQTCQATFSVSSTPPVVLICPTNTTVAACQSQASVNTAFATWLATVSASGGCNGVLTNNNTGAPSACGGSTTVTFTYTSNCAPTSTTCQATFTVPASPTVVLNCPTNTTVAACQSQASVNTAFATWLATVSATGGCNGVLTNNNTGAPSACGGSTTVTFTYTSNCAPTSTTCQATFTVPASPTVVLTCPTNTTVAACQSQASVNTAFATWLASVSASGGCNGVLTNNNTGAPSACGGSTTVTFTYTSNCAPTSTTCQATFTVPASPTVVLNCPTNTTVAACQSQASVNTAFATWLASVSASGGCNGVLTNNNTGAPAACGGSTTVTFTYTSNCAPTSTTCQATFTVPASPTVVLNCPTNTTVAACQSQASVNTAFATWLASVSASGGCNGVLTNNNTGAPAACGGSTTVTFTYTSDCAPTSTTCQATFTVPASPTVVLNCPTNTTVAACQSQASVNTAFATWLASVSASGGCNGVLTNNNTGAPAACGGSTTVTFTYTSNCAPTSTTCQATFTVPASPTVVLNCPTNTTVAACQSQATVNTAFATWLASVSASGGCNGVLTNNNTGAPSACGGSTTVTFTYTSNCAPTSTTCQATFTVPASPTVVLNCPTNTTVAACQSQASVNTAFATWLASVSASGGCNGVLTNNNTGAPSACGGSTTVTFTYTSDCAPTSTTCQATFTVPASPTVVLNCPTNTTVAACQSQASVNTAFATWLASVSASGGCNGVLTNNNTGAPSACGGSTTVTFTYTSNCAPTSTTCQATFTVPASPTVVLNCPTNTTVAACQSQASVNTAFATWLASVSASGGCNGVLTNNNTGAPSACGGSTTVTFTYTSNCAPTSTTCQATFTVASAPAVELTCPANTALTTCQSQASINTAFATWLASASATGGCNGVFTNNNTGAPSANGGSTTVTFTYTSDCAPLTTTCQATFTTPSLPTAGATFSETSAAINNDGVICAGASVTLTGTGGTSYAWSNGVNAAANPVTPASTTTYTVTVTNANGCSATTSAVIIVLPNTTYYKDADADGYGNPAITSLSCAGAPSTFVADNSDCNDNSNVVFPGAFETCGSAIDNNCDGNVSSVIVAPILVSQVVTGGSVKLIWSGSCTFRYRIQVQKVGTSTWTYYYTNGSVSNLTLPNLAPGTYRWTVRAQSVSNTGPYTNPMATPNTFVIPIVP